VDFHRCLAGVPDLVEHRAGLAADALHPRWWGITQDDRGPLVIVSGHDSPEAGIHALEPHFERCEATRVHVAEHRVLAILGIDTINARIRPAGISFRWPCRPTNERLGDR